MLIDLHTHTRVHSMDSVLSPDELVGGAKAAGLDGICITEHDQFWSAGEIARLARRHDLLVLPGCEVTTEEGHILVFGVSGYVFGMHRARTLRAIVERAGGVMLMAHPYRRQFSAEDAPWVAPYEEQVARACANPALEAAHAVEALNGRGTPRENGFSHDVCRRRGLPAIGASDTHEPAEIGRCATEFDDRIAGLEELIAALKSGRYRPVDLRDGR